MMMARRLLLLALSTAPWSLWRGSLSPAVGQGRAQIPVLAGTVTTKNYFRLEKALIANLDKIVGLQLYFDDTAETAPLVAQADADQFIAYLRVPKTTSEIVAAKGYKMQGKGYVLNGYYRVKNGGTHQGIVSIGLELADEKQVMSSKPILQRVQL